MLSGWLISKVLFNSEGINSESYEMTSSKAKSVRMSLLIVLELNMIEIFYRARTIDFFAGFYRQLKQTIKDSLPYLTMLGISVLT